MKLSPSRIDPIFVPRIWGARSLAPLFPDHSAEQEPIGEVWLTGSECRIATGAFAGRKLGEAWREMGVEWTGTRARDMELFPLLVKFLFPTEKLSVQVHPTDEYARKNEAAVGGRGKTEMWYAISARPGAEVMVGLRGGVTRDAFRRAIGDGTVENCLEHIVMQAGDVIFVPAGTTHTIGPGLVLCEIQQHSDLTYRVFDYNRLTAEGKPRPLHVDKALEVIEFGKQRGGKIAPISLNGREGRETYYVACRYFATERWEFEQRLEGQTYPEHFELLIILAGRGQISAQGEKQNYEPAQVWLLPAALGNYKLQADAPTALLRTYVPDLDEVASRMKQRGLPEEAVARLVQR